MRCLVRRLPPLNALKAFEAAARHESFTRAAEELFVTQGAVSHQVKALEEELGVKLFNRERQRLVITEAGRQYLTILRDAFDRIALGTERLLQRQSSGALTVSTSPDFAAKWLVNRLGRFAEEYPSIDLRVSATLHHVDFAREDVDLAVRHGDGNWVLMSRGSVQRTCFRCAAPSCSPGAIGSPSQDLLDHLSQGYGWPGEDRDLSRLASGRGRQRCAPAQEAGCIPDQELTLPRAGVDSARGLMAIAP